MIKFLYRDLKLFVFLLFIFFQSSAQVGIGTTDPSPGAMLDIASSDKGIMIPRVDLTNLATLAPIIGAAEAGLLVYNTNTTTGPGFFYWNGTNSWIAVGGTDKQLGTHNQTLSGTRNIDFNGYSLNFTNNSVTQLNDGQLRLRNDPNHALRWAGSGNTFAGISKDGPALYGYRGGVLGSKLSTTGGESIALEWTENGRVSIGGTTSNPSASLDLIAGDKGILLNRVSLTATNATSPITAPATGLLIYNTATAGTGSTAVSPGFYYWNGSRWIKFGSNNYTIQYVQTTETEAHNTVGTYVNIAGLNQNFVAPVTGTYQIAVTAYYASGTLSNTSQERGAGEALIGLMKDTEELAHRLVVSHSFRFGTTTAFELSDQITFLVNVALTAGQTYNFRVRGKEIIRYNTERGVFGADTSNAAGYTNMGTYNDGSRASMTITLINQN